MNPVATLPKIGLIARLRSLASADTVAQLFEFLSSQHYPIVTDSETATLLPQMTCPVFPKHEFGKQCDIAIVIGGDGSILNAAHILVEHDIPLVGIHRGRLGFLTDIPPADDMQAKVLAILQGHYIEEYRFMLEAAICSPKGDVFHTMALNELVLLPGELAHMIEFEIYINQQLVCHQRADGQIIATPTGSTAYALSGGGPILHPALEAIVLVPMFSHTLTARPIVVGSDSSIEIRISKSNENSPFVSCDGLERMAVVPGSVIKIQRKPKRLRLWHPQDYQYFETLRNKLHWQKGV